MSRRLTTPSGGAGSLDVRVLGPLEVWRDETPITIPGHKARMLLACLVAAGGNAVSRDRLIDAIWGETPPKSAVNTLHTYITHLRTALADGSEHSAITTHPNGYRLSLDDDEVDAWRLERFVVDARRLVDRREFSQAVETLDSALAAWRGPPLEEFADAALVGTEAGRLAEVRYGAEELRVSSLLEAGQAKRAVVLLERLVDEFPLREQLWEHLMIALYRCGRQADALSAFRRLNEVLAEVGLEPSNGPIDLESRILEKDPSLLHRDLEPVATPVHRPIPRAPTSFVGRLRELVELEALGGDARLLTLTGIGGIGKSHLALEHGHRETAGGYTAGCYVDLATAAGADVVLARLAESLGIVELPGHSSLELIAERVGSGDLLLIVDNAETSVTALAGALPELLSRCPGLRIVVTSREPLAVQAESTYPVAPLATDGEAATSDAVELFIRRAKTIDSPDDVELEAIAGICRALDGMPAAIEVVAASTRILSVTEVADHLEDLLAGDEDRQSLPAVLEWTYQALSPDQQHLFLSASLFPDGFTFDALTQVAASSDERRQVLANVGALVDRSLVSVHGGTPSRYRVLDVFRHYGLSWLAGSPRAADARARFVAYFEAMATDLDRSIGTERWRRLLERVDADEANCAQAIEIALEIGDTIAAYRIAGPMARYWRWRGRSEEGAGRLSDLMERTAVEGAERGKVEREMAATLRVLGRFDSARIHAERAVAMSSGLDDPRGEADALYDLGMSMIFAGEFEAAAGLLGRSAAVWERLEERSLMAFPMIPIAWLDMVRGDYERAENRWRSILTDVDTSRFPQHSGITFRVAELALAQGQLERAERLARGALESALEARYPYHEAGARVILANVHLANGLAEPAQSEADRALAAAMDSGNAEGAAQALVVSVRLAKDAGDTDSALSRLPALTRFAHHAGGPLAWAVIAELTGSIQAARGEMLHAATLYGAAEAIRSSHRLPAGWLDRRFRDRDIESIRAFLGASEFEAAFEEGLSSTEEQVRRHVSAVSI
ncbi:MAG: winged helix-turn-helix domain-containing protein [Acidimicrobiia bacterium]|nr:winged helix-turn-helix domain-containing protein [Acidimicrobiia bacterium]